MSRIGTIMSGEDVTALADWASEQVEIAIYGVSRTYSVAQSRYVLKEFFDSIDVSGFFVNEFTQSDTGLFIEGQIEVPASQYPVRVYLRMMKSGEDWVLRELLFERKSY